MMLVTCAHEERAIEHAPFLEQESVLATRLPKVDVESTVFLLSALLCDRRPVTYCGCCFA